MLTNTMYQCYNFTFLNPVHIQIYLEAFIIEKGGVLDVKIRHAKEIKSSEGNQTLDNSALFHGRSAVGRKTQQASNQSKHKQQPGTMKGKEIMFVFMHTSS